MRQFSALQAIAARRGDGLKPDLVRLLARSRAEAEASPATLADDVEKPLDAQNRKKSRRNNLPKG
jgi:hypothetical protein